MIYDTIQLRKELGERLQEYVAIQLEQYYPAPEFIIHSRKKESQDLLITNNNGFKLTCEVKSAKELFSQEWIHKRTHIEKSEIHRGEFTIDQKQLSSDFFAFIIRFVDDKFEWSESFEDTETWYALGGNVCSYMLSKPKAPEKLRISELPLVKATLNLTDLNLPKQEPEIDVEALFT